MEENMLVEATKRLEILQDMGLWDEVARVWKEKETACVSEARIVFDVCGVNFTFDEMPELKHIKEKFEAEYGYTVYYGIYSNTKCGKMLTLLFVSTYEEEWEDDQNDLKEGYPVAYVWNMEDEFGEIGSVGIKMANGGLIRTA